MKKNDCKQPDGTSQAQTGTNTGEPSLFTQFIRTYFFDPKTLFESVAGQDRRHYLYFGDLKENIFFISDHMKKDFAFESNIVRDWLSKWGDLIVEADRENYRSDISDIFSRKKQHHSVNYRVKNYRGEAVWVHGQSLIKWQEDQPVFFAGIVTDLQEDLNIDPVTGLLRSVALMNRLKELTKTGGWVIAFGLNDFSSINDTIGRTMANRVLRKIFQILQSDQSNQLNFFRIDGVKFVAIAGNPNTVPPTATANRIKSAIDDVYVSANLFMKNPCSIGFLQIPKDYGVDGEIIQVLSNLINLAKRQPQDGFIIFSENAWEEKQSRAKKLLSLNKSVTNRFKDFFIEVQPIIDARKKSILGGEVLLRWKPGGRVVAPSEFIPLLESHHLIHSVGNWVFEQTVALCKKAVKFAPDILLSCNISYLQIFKPSFFPFLKTTMEKTGVSGRNLVLELTETVTDESHEILYRFINKIRKEKMRFAIDDLGSGYSSLNFLFECPADIVKIDKALTKKILASRFNKNVLKTIVYACHEAKKRVCIEGIETEEELIEIMQLGGDSLQGFYFYKPMPAKAFLDLLKKGSPHA